MTHFLSDSLPYIGSHLDQLAFGLAAVFVVLIAVAAAAWGSK